MAVLHTLRTNKVLKTVTFIIIGAGMFLFVDPGFDSFKTIKMIFSSEKNELELNSFGAVHGHQLYNTYERPNPNGGPSLFVEEPEDIAMQAHMSYLEFIQQSQNVSNTKKRNLNGIWDHFNQRSFIKKEMESHEFKFSKAEKIDLVKGTITGIDNAAPFFTSWWRALRTNEAGEVDSSIDGKVLEDSIAVWTENSKVNQNQGNYLNYNFIFKPFNISNHEITRFVSLYNMGTFAPKAFLEQEYLDSKKTLNGKYIYIPFRDIKDSEIEVTEEEITEYYNSNKEEFLNDTDDRVIDYYIFDAEPSPEDIEFSMSRMTEWMDSGGGVSKIKTLVLDTANANQELLNFVTNESDNKNIVSVEKYSKKEWEEYLSKVKVPKENRIGDDDLFGPFVELGKAEILKLGIRVRQELDTIEVVFLNKQIKPSPKTTNENFVKAKDFLYSSQKAEEFESEAKKITNVIIKKNVSISKLDEDLSGIESNARNIIRWSFGIPDNINVSLSDLILEEREGSVRRFKANIFDQVVVFVKDINNGEYKDIEVVKSQIKKTLLETKKSKLIQEKISKNWSDDINELAKSLNTKVNLASKFSFSAANFSVGGNDPGATGFFFGVKENEISQPYVGNKGVFIFQRTETIKPEILDEEVVSSKQKILGNANSEFNLNVIEQSKSSKAIDMRHMSF